MQEHLIAPVTALLAEETAEWWYHKQLRDEGNHKEATERENRSVNSNLSTIEEALLNGGYLSIGRGGWALHYSGNDTLSGYGGIDSRIPQACILAGVPTIDTSVIPYPEILDSVRFPMIAVSPQEVDERPWSSLSYAPFLEIAFRYHSLGAKLYNVGLTIIPD